MPSPPTVVEVQHTDQRFLTFPWQVYRGDPDWVPPMIADDRDVLQPGGVFFEHADGALFLAERDGKPVGRIMAAFDHESTEKDVGIIGFFECFDDESVARALFERAEAWLRAKGLKRARGPISPSLLLGPIGILLEGRGRPVILLPYNPPYYAKLYEACGWQKSKDLYAYIGKVADEGIDDALKRGMAALAKEGLTFRPLDKKKIVDEMRIFTDVHNKAYANMGHYAYTPCTPRESEFLAVHFKDILDPDLFIFVEKDGKAVGVAAGIPDASEMMQKLNGKLGPIRLIKALLAQRRIKTVRIADFCVDPAANLKFLGTTVGAYLMHNARKKGYQTVEYSWILEDNVKSRKSAEHGGGKVYRTYRVYEKAL
jgi:GNAT superfamily N-acetyltransferase